MKRCIRCHEVVYLVQSARGERFLVTTRDGKRWCS